MEVIRTLTNLTWMISFFQKHKTFNKIICEVEWSTLRKLDGNIFSPLNQNEMNKFIKCLKFCYPLINHMCLYSGERLNGIKQCYCPYSEAVIGWRYDYFGPMIDHITICKHRNNAATFPMNHNMLVAHFKFYSEICVFHEILHYHSKHIIYCVDLLQTKDHPVFYIQPTYEEVKVIDVKIPEEPWPE